MLAPDEYNSAMALQSVGCVCPQRSLPRRMKSPENPADGLEDVRTLTLAIRRGEAAAFSRFCDLYSFRLYKFLLVLARDDNNARELVQTVLIKLAKRVEVFDEERQLWAWLCVLARNAFLDRCRARQRDRQFVPLHELPVELDTPANPDAQLSESLHEALAQLAPEERELIHAAYVDGCSLRELADASGQTYKAVESRLARLRRKLKQHLLKHLYHEHQP